MKLYGFPTQENGCGYYRNWMPLEAIQRAGLAEVDRENDKPDTISIERAAAIFDWADVVFCQPFSQLWAASIILAARDEKKKKLVVDLDDDVWSVHPMNVGPVKGKLISLRSHFHGQFQDFWEMQKVTKEEAKKYRDRIDGTLVKNEKNEIFFLKNTCEDVKLAVEFIIKECDAVTTTNDVLADKIRQHTDKPVYMVPNCIDLSKWRKAIPSVSGFMSNWIGWAGSVSHYPDLKHVIPALDKLVSRYPDIGVQIMGSSFDYLFPPKEGARKFPISGYGPDDAMFYADLEDSGERWPGRMKFHKPVPIQEYIEWICGNWCSQIGIAPIEKNDFNDAKSELKWLEYTAMGIPTVASNFGPYKRAIRHNEDGLLVDCPDFWYPALHEMLKHEEKREKLVKNATERLHADYDIDKKAKDWLEIFESCISGVEACAAT